MSISPARIAAFDVLVRVERENAYGTELLHSASYRQLSQADHALATELTMGVLRWRSLLDRQITETSSQRIEKLDLEVLTALRLAAYQLGFLTRVPERAAVHESVELVKRARKRSAVPFANAVLRKLGAARVETLAVGRIAEASNPVELAELSAHPLWLLQRWEQQFGLEAVRKICIHDQTIPPVAVRIDSSDTENELKREGVEIGGGRFLTSARRVLSGNITKTRGFLEGRVAIQDEASQLAAMLVGEGKNILDCCAAPGGKTRILAARNPESNILAAELHPHRARLLRRRVGEKNVKVIAADARELPLRLSFDQVLVDVPCSGTGTLAHNPEIKWRLELADLQDLHSRQVEILRSVMNQVASAGRVIYSTCSMEPEENAAVVEEALRENPMFRVLDCRLELEELREAGELAWADLDSLVSGPFLRTIPGIHPCDGFFAAILRRE